MGKNGLIGRKLAQEDDIIGNLEPLDSNTSFDPDLEGLDNIEDLPDYTAIPQQDPGTIKPLPEAVELDQNPTYSESDIPQSSTEQDPSLINKIYRGTVEHLPDIGMIGGGLLGSPGGIGGSMAGAAGGRMAGQQLKEYLSPDQSRMTGEEKLQQGLLGGSSELGGQLTTKIIGKAAPSILGWAGKINPKAIKTYIEDAPGVQKMVQESSGNVAQAANDIRDKIRNSIDIFRKSKNAKISSELGKSTETINPSEAFNELIAARNQLSALPSANKSEISALDELIDNLSKDLSNEGIFTPTQANEARGVLQREASFETTPTGFQKGSAFGKGSKGARAKLTEKLYEKVPGLKKPYSDLEKLHNLEAELKGNILGEKAGPEGLLKAAGNITGKEANDIRKLTELIKSPMTSELDKLNAMNQLYGYVKPGFDTIRRGAVKGALDYGRPIVGPGSKLMLRGLIGEPSSSLPPKESK